MASFWMRSSRIGSLSGFFIALLPECGVLMYVRSATGGRSGFAETSTVELLYLVCVEGRRYRPVQALAVLACLRQASTNSFPENLPLELREDGQQCRHGSTGWGRQVQCLRQRYEADAEMFQFVQGRQQVRDGPSPPVQPPY